jgi:hypothetical protein
MGFTGSRSAKLSGGKAKISAVLVQRCILVAYHQVYYFVKRQNVWFRA